MNLIFKRDTPCHEETLKLYKDADIYNEQWNSERMKLTLKNSSLLLCCYDSDRLIGIVRGITDFYWIAHISHLAVHPDFQGKGIGKELVARVNNQLGDGVALMVHSDPKAKQFYEKLGFEIYDDVYRISRKK
jgi:ribosomal protein S18 acetylase RimI-like enzyme